MFDGPVTIQKLLEGMKRFEASDLHVKVGIQPVYRSFVVLTASR